MAVDMKMNVAIIVPNWNGKQLLAECLESLQKQSIDSQIIVVDNGSTDGSVELLSDKFPSVEVVRLSKNHGFAGGVNAGLRKVLNEVEYVALFNNDAVAEKHWLELLVTAMQTRPQAGIVTGKLMRNDRKHIDSTGEYVRTNGMPFPRGRDETDHGQYDQAEYVFAASGGASLYRTSMLKKIGLFDEGFFAYFEDVDISFRAQLAGWKVWYEPAAIAYHQIGQTSGRLKSFTRYHSIKNFMLLYLKNMPGKLFWKYWARHFLQLVRMKLGSLRHGQFGAFIKGYFVALWLTPKALAERHKIQSRRKVSIEYIDTMLQHKSRNR